MPRHHLVPQMLLRRFAKSDQLLMVPRDRLGTSVRSTVKNACAQVGFYRIETEDLEPHAREGHDPEQVEAVLADVESTAKPLVDQLCDGRLLSSDEDRFQFAFFAALQMCRGEAFRQDAEAWVNASARLHLPFAIDDEEVAALLLQRGHPHDKNAIAAFREEMQTSPWRIVSHQSAQVQDALRQAVTVVLPVLYERPWKLLRFNQPLLLTSDTPIAPWSPDGPPGTPPPALMTAQELYFPLDRFTCLSFTRSLVHDQVITMRPERAARINTVVAGEARRWIFHHPDDRPLNGLSVPPPGVIVEEIHEVVPQSDGTVRTRGMLVKRPRSSTNE